MAGKVHRKLRLTRKEQSCVGKGAGQSCRHSVFPSGVVDEWEGWRSVVSRTPPPVDRVTGGAWLSVMSQAVWPSLKGSGWASGSSTLATTTYGSQARESCGGTDHLFPSTCFGNDGTSTNTIRLPDWTLNDSCPRLPPRVPSAGSASCTQLGAADFGEFLLELARCSAWDNELTEIVSVEDWLRPPVSHCHDLWQHPVAGPQKRRCHTLDVMRPHLESRFQVVRESLLSRKY